MLHYLTHPLQQLVNTFLWTVAAWKNLPCVKCDRVRNWHMWMTGWNKTDCLLGEIYTFHWCKIHFRTEQKSIVIIKQREVLLNNAYLYFYLCLPTEWITLPKFLENIFIFLSYLTPHTPINITNQHISWYNIYTTPI